MKGDLALDDVGLVSHAFFAFWHTAYHQGSLPIFTVYRPTTADYPGRWVVRFEAVPGGKSNTVFLANSLEAARAVIPAGQHRMPRADTDDPVIEEVWI